MLFSGRAQNDTKDSKEHVLPNLEQLINLAKNHLRKEYTRNNKSRLELITFLEIVHEIIEKRSKSGTFSESELQSICLGAWVFCLETIANTYMLLNPKFENHNLYPSGSTLYNLLLNKLGIDKDQQISEIKKLEYLGKFYHFIFKEEEIIDVPDEISILHHMHLKHVSIPLKEQLIKTMQDILAKQTRTEHRVLRAIPSETAIDYKMGKLFSDYTSESKTENPERIFLTQLAVAICKLNSSKFDIEQNELDSFLSRSERVKIGALIYIMQSIKDTYYLRSPSGNSFLYDLCNQALLDCYTNLDSHTKFICLTAFVNYLNDTKNRDDLEKYINMNLLEDKTSKAIYIDPKIHSIVKGANNMIEKLDPTAPIGPSKVTLSLAALGAIVGAAPGYGVGYTLGYGLSLLDQANRQKSLFSQFTRSAMTVFFDSGSYFGYYAADLMITATMERFFGKIFEALGSLAFAAGTGALSFVVYDLSYKTARHLCHLYLNLSKNMDSTKLSQNDLEVINVLLELPESVFSQNKKERLKHVIDLSDKPLSIVLLSGNKLELKEQKIEEKTTLDPSNLNPKLG